jgi:hypothetical protein
MNLRESKLLNLKISILNDPSSTFQLHLLTSFDSFKCRNLLKTLLSLFRKNIDKHEMKQESKSIA